jgi:hypothetical protein
MELAAARAVYLELRPGLLWAVPLGPIVAYARILTRNWNCYSNAFNPRPNKLKTTQNVAKDPGWKSEGVPDILHTRSSGSELRLEMRAPD